MFGADSRSKLAGGARAAGEETKNWRPSVESFDSSVKRKSAAEPNGGGPINKTTKQQVSSSKGPPPPRSLEKQGLRLFPSRQASSWPGNQEDQDEDERREFIVGSKSEQQVAAEARRARLAKAETIEEAEEGCNRWLCGCCCGRWCCCCRMLSGRCLLCVLILLVLYAAAIYSLPYLEISPKTPEAQPNIPFNFREGPLKASSASQFKASKLFEGQIHGAESVAVDSSGNLYMAIEGGFVLYGHLNKNSAPKRAYYEHLAGPAGLEGLELPKLVKIAELNGVRAHGRQRNQRDSGQQMAYEAQVWRRECQLDELVYGRELYSPIGQQQQPEEFRSRVAVSRCSKPLGMRLSPDESYLLVVDTLSGLYKVNLKVAERPHSSQRLVTRLIDFRSPRMLLAIQLDGDQEGRPLAVRHLNVSMRAVDDLVVDFGAGTRSGDIIYLTLASQRWPAISFVYDMLEGSPSGLILRFDTGNNQLVVLEPTRVAHVRTATLELFGGQPLERPLAADPPEALMTTAPYFGAPRLDESDVFDDRPLHFPNGLELMDDRQAILIADTSNKRIIKHYIRGPRRGASDLWAWAPMFPDNIRRGFDRRQETYWVVGCGSERGYPIDITVWLRTWPRARKLLLKQIYLVGWLLEQVGVYLLRSDSLRDYGYALKEGGSLCEKSCLGMMVLQYNSQGDLVKSVHSREFPNDLYYYSQANEQIDVQNQEHSLFLSSPSYPYVTKLTLPTDNLELPPSPP